MKVDARMIWGWDEQKWSRGTQVGIRGLCFGSRRDEKDVALSWATLVAVILGIGSASDRKYITEKFLKSKISYHNYYPSICLYQNNTHFFFSWQNLPTRSLSWAQKICVNWDSKENALISQKKDIKTDWVNNFIHLHTVCSNTFKVLSFTTSNIY